MGDGTKYVMADHTTADCVKEDYFFRCLQHTPDARDEDMIEMVKEKLFYAPLNEEVGDYLLHVFSRAIGRHIEDKRFYMMIGNSNAGKGVLMNAMEEAFRGLVGHFNNEDLIYKRGGADTAKSLSWLLNLSGDHIVFADEAENGSGVKISGNILKKMANGGSMLTGRRNFGDETTFYPTATPFSAMNDLPAIEMDSGVRNRLMTFDFRKTFTTKVEHPKYELQADPHIKKKVARHDWASAVFWAVMDAYDDEEISPPDECIAFKEEICESESMDEKIASLFEIDYEGDGVKTDKFLKIVKQQADIPISLYKLSRLMKKLGAGAVVKSPKGKKSYKAYPIRIPHEDTCDW